MTAVVCLAVGALASKWVPLDTPPSHPASRASPQIPDRHRVLSRSKNPTLEQLEALGYVEATYDSRSDLSGVIRHLKDRTSPGYNFYTSGAGARLVDMEGREIHRWQADERRTWQHAELLSNGDVIAVTPDRRLGRYDLRGRRLWAVKGRFHHNFWIQGDEIFALSRVGRVIEDIHPQRETLVDVIQVLSLDGTPKRELSVLKAFLDSPYHFLLPSVTHQRPEKLPGQLDITHTNHVEVFDGRLAGRDPLYARGNILLSARNINAVFILDGRTSEILWIWGPSNLTFQHQPTLLESGHILIFDNGLERSRVIEVEPRSGDLVWSYAPPEGFFSEYRGSNQRLPNGNTLITESDKGYVREVTPRGEVVWEFANPVISSNKEREIIWRMTRIDPQRLNFLRRQGAAGS
jgi:hypothetical protein